LSVSATARIERLTDVSARQMIDPDVGVPGALQDGQVIADELLSVAGLGLELTAEQRRVLSCEEIASILQEGIRFEVVLGAGFNLQLSEAPDLTDPRVTYALHELGEETRHSRLFIRLVAQLGPQARNPFEHGVLAMVKRSLIRSILDRPALFAVLVLAGEEIPDLINKIAAEHPGTDPFLRDVSRYHRQEEARHLAFARTVLPELWAEASWWEKLRVRYQAPVLITLMFDSLVHPGVYETVGLPGWRTWQAVKRSESRRALRHQATRRVLDAVVDAGIFHRGHLPRGWRRLTGVS
jgi:predicted metal-dependent hydrolase